MILLRVESVSKTFPSLNGSSTSPASRAVPVSVLEDVSLTLRSGEIIAIVGPSGIGKSTLLRLCAGALPPDAPTDTGIATIWRADGVSIVWQPQNAPLVHTRNVLANAAIGAQAAGLGMKDAREASKAALERVGLASWLHARPNVLSGGMRQRAVLARTLAAKPRIALLDEPFSSLDPVLRRRLARALSDYVLGQGSGIAMVTHTMEEAIDFAHRIYVLNGTPGRVVLIAAKSNDLLAPEDSEAGARTVVTNRRGELFERVSEALITPGGDT